MQDIKNQNFKTSHIEQLQKFNLINTKLLTTDGSYTTPLLISISYQCPASYTKSLINAGADLTNTHNGNNALHYAVSQNPNPEIVKTLLQKGVKTDAKNDAGHTVIDLNSNEAILPLLTGNKGPKQEAQHHKANHPQLNNIQKTSALTTILGTALLIISIFTTPILAIIGGTITVLSIAGLSFGGDERVNTPPPPTPQPNTSQLTTPELQKNYTLALTTQHTKQTKGR